MLHGRGEPVSLSKGEKPKEEGGSGGRHDVTNMADLAAAIFGQKERQNLAIAVCEI